MGIFLKHRTSNRGIEDEDEQEDEFAEGFDGNLVSRPVLP
jgi:hypothetical protein